MITERERTRLETTLDRLSNELAQVAGLVADLARIVAELDLDRPVPSTEELNRISLEALEQQEPPQ